MGEKDYWLRLARALRSELDSSLRSWAGLPVVDYFIGFQYAYVQLEGGWCGVAAAPYWSGRRHEPLAEALEDATPRMLARLVEKTANSLAASLALAAVNAATNAWIECTTEPGIEFGLDALDLVKSGSGTVILVGYMAPIARKLRKMGYKVYVTELERRLVAKASIDGFPVIGGLELEHVAANADMFVVSGAALIDPPSLFPLLESARSAEIVLVGASSSFHPRIAWRLSASIVAGIYIDRTVCSYVRRAVAQGGGPYMVERSWGVRLVKWAAARQS
ncbi:Rossmann-like domain-containing protein [Hyperthermus butylicus]|uniref:Heavy-metal chelation domain-containing protein n=1 Tax=Hyperthermus butylicus (strain DSM 5456 / JCM 9403 / PLM1-5) TaxID=415426 RepID=A2BJR0_HYPBU|nr:DUF364 domain-containing protein [Hyperthermus butylicus]ABM80221.1 conserved archaeal protein/domain of unknown function [Hyperthermus butylicus DSM 5456]